jgi:hypothetical protein
MKSLPPPITQNLTLMKKKLLLVFLVGSALLAKAQWTLAPKFDMSFFGGTNGHATPLVGTGGYIAYKLGRSETFIAGTYFFPSTCVIDQETIRTSLVSFSLGERLFFIGDDESGWGGSFLGSIDFLPFSQKNLTRNTSINPLGILFSFGLGTQYAFDGAKLFLDVQYRFGFNSSFLNGNLFPKQDFFTNNLAVSVGYAFMLGDDSQDIPLRRFPFF